ncbi:hypothetical protein MHK_005926, partial [Candidatus Magnetomorum sp. HK-1]
HGKMGLGPYGAFLNIMFAVQKIGRKILNPLNAKLRVSRTFVRKYMPSNGSKSTLQTLLKKTEYSFHQKRCCIVNQGFIVIERRRPMWLPGTLAQPRLADSQSFASLFKVPLRSTRFEPDDGP